MAEFTITLLGKADADEVREAFEIAVRAVRGALDEADGSIDGELVLDGLPYPAEDVSDEAAGADDDPDGTDEDDSEAADEAEAAAVEDEDGEPG